MEREYLHEDLAQVKRYFPGARAVTLRTPFDLSPLEERLRFLADDITEDADWYGGLLWNRS